MFDYVICHRLLPDDPPAMELQTQDFGCRLDTYIITEVGRLLIRRWVVDRTVKDDSAPLGVRWESHDEPDEDTRFHGDVTFYGQAGGSWYEYTARFTEGQLQHIKRIHRRDNT